MSVIQIIAIMAIPLIFAITVHEVAHGYVAWKFGDPTAKMLGRLTLNPLKHIDPVGTILVPCLLAYFGGIIFGWAKPVPVDGRNFKNFNRNMFVVALAGPFANLIMAVLWFGLLLGMYFAGISQGGELQLFYYMADYGVKINLVLLVLNLLPIPPLDGGRALLCLLPGKISWQVSQYEQIGFFILVALIFSGALSIIISPVFALYNSLLVAIVG